MGNYYKVGSTTEVAGSEAEATEKMLAYYAQGKIPVKCKGRLTFEDYRTANYYYNKIVYQNPHSLFFVDAENETNPTFYTIIFENSQTLLFDFNYFFLKSLAQENHALIKQVFEASVFGNILFETGSAATNPSTFVNKNSYKKDKPDNIREVKIRGEASSSKHTLAKDNYVFLTLQLPNTIFYPPSEIFTNIRLEGNKIHFDCNRFFDKSLLEENRAAIEKVLRLADNGYAVIEERLTENTICGYVMKRTLGGFEISNLEVCKVQEEAK